MALNFIPTNTNINFVKARFIFFFISLTIMLGSLGFMFFKGLNYGVDFKGGLLVSMRTPENIKIGDLRKTLSTLNIGEISLQEIGSPHDIQMKIENPGEETNQQNTMLTKIKAALGPKIEYRTIDTVGPKVGQELIYNAIKAVVWALIAMLAYVWIRFEWQFALGAIIAIIHDCLAIVGMYGVTQLEFNTTAIMAILVTAGYSINDTIVIFDRIRENLVKYKKMPFAELINKSMNETLSRTILTSTTTLIAMFGLYFFGGEIIATYSLPIIVGIMVGTYSSICFAAPLLLYLGFKRDNSRNEKSKTGELNESA